MKPGLNALHFPPLQPGVTFPAQNTSPTEHGCKAQSCNKGRPARLQCDAHSGGNFVPPAHPLTYCPAQVQSTDGSRIQMQQEPPVTQKQPRGAHLSISPPANSCTVFHLQNNNAKMGSPVMPGTAQRSPRKEKSKLPQVSCSMARPQWSPCH